MKNIEEVDNSGDVADWRIVRMLLENESLSQRQIAAALSRPEGQIQRRLSALKKTSVIHDSITVWDWEALGLPLRFRIDIVLDQSAILDPKTGGGPLDDKGQPAGNNGRAIRTQQAVARFIRKDLIEYICRGANDSNGEESLDPLKDELFVEDVVILLGNPTADLSAFVRARNTASILRLVTAGLRAMKGIKATSTYQEAWSSRDGTISERRSRK